MTEKSNKEWNIFYLEKENKNMPWYIPHLDPDVKKAVEDMQIKGGSFLDIGTGPGTQAFALSEMGFDVTAIDVSKNAIDRAKKIISGVDFLRDDITNTSITKTFDYILDRGCLHSLKPEKRSEYIKNVKMLLVDGGYLFLKTFSEKEKEHEKGPNRFSEKQIRYIFSEGFNVIQTKETEFYGTRKPYPKALFSVIERKRED